MELTPLIDQAVAILTHFQTQTKRPSPRHLVLQVLLINESSHDVSVVYHYLSAPLVYCVVYMCNYT